MSDELLIMHGILSQLPEANRKTVESVAEKIRSMIREDEASGLLAVAWIALEIHNKDAK